MLGVSGNACPNDSPGSTAQTVNLARQATDGISASLMVTDGISGKSDGKSSKSEGKLKVVHPKAVIVSLKATGISGKV